MNGICQICNQMVLAPPVPFVGEARARLEFVGLADAMAVHLRQHHPARLAEVNGALVADVVRLRSILLMCCLEEETMQQFDLLVSRVTRALTAGDENVPI